MRTAGSERVFVQDTLGTAVGRTRRSIGVGVPSSRIDFSAGQVRGRRRKPRAHTPSSGARPPVWSRESGFRPPVRLLRRGRLELTRGHGIRFRDMQRYWRRDLGRITM